jgi:NitT/TauT family transport system substrate-binding protein
MHVLSISATAHGINYLPEYHASVTGTFARLGLEVQARARDPWTGVLDDLADGSADVALGGTWVPAMFAGRGRDLVATGQVNGRFPMAIVTRAPVEEFDWSWMAGRTVLVPGGGGTAPYEFTAGLMREGGCDSAGVKFVRDLSTELLRELYENGLGDAMVADPLTAHVLQLGGHGFICPEARDSFRIGERRALQLDVHSISWFAQASGERTDTPATAVPDPVVAKPVIPDGPTRQRVH